MIMISSCISFVKIESCFKNLIEINTNGKLFYLRDEKSNNLNKSSNQYFFLKIYFY